MSEKQELEQANVRRERTVKLGTFKLGKVIGYGTYATVRLAHHEDTGELYAVKVIDKRQLDVSVYERQTRREISVLTILDHPNIIKVKEMMESRSCTYLVMEHMEGGELFEEIVRKEHLEENQARRYFKQLTDALSYAHSRGIMHRDIKPENILLDRERRNIKVIDFGMSWLREADNPSSVMKTHCGTTKYMPPELLSHSGGQYNATAVDVWSCGMTLFACLAGYVPYDCDTTDAKAVLAELQSKDEIEFPEWFSGDVCDLLRKALEKDPKRRATMRTLKEHRWTRGCGIEEVKIDEVIMEGKVELSPVSPYGNGWDQDESRR